MVSSKQLSPPETPQTHPGRGPVFHRLPWLAHPDTTALLRRQPDPTASPRQDGLLRAGGHPRSTGSSYQRLNALLWLPIHPHVREPGGETLVFSKGLKRKRKPASLENGLHPHPTCT